MRNTALSKSLWIKLAVTFLVIVMAGLLAIPVAIRYAAVSWLKKNGASLATIEDVDFNPLKNDEAYAIGVS